MKHGTQHKQHNDRRARWPEWLRPGVILFAMTAILCWATQYSLGLAGALAALGALAATLLLTPQPSPRTLLRVHGARRVRRDEYPALRSHVSTLAKRARMRRPPTLFVLPDPTPNAFAVQQRGQMAIAVSEGLIRQLSVAELMGVVAHEIGHLRHRDTGLMALADLCGVLTRSLAGAGLAVTIAGTVGILDAGNVPPAYVLIGLLGAPMLTRWLRAALARTREFQADVAAIRLTSAPDALASALGKLERYRRVDRVGRVALRFGFGRSPFDSHPTAQERIRRLLSTREGLPTSARYGIALAKPHTLTTRTPNVWRTVLGLAGYSPIRNP